MVKVSPKQPVKAQITTPTRFLDTIYQNTTGRPILILVTIYSNVTAVGGDAYVFGEYAATTPPNLIQARSGLFDAPVGKGYFEIVLAVPPAYYFRISATEIDGTVLINRWTEVEL